MSIMKIMEILRRTRAYINVDDHDSYFDFETVLLLASRLASFIGSSGSVEA